MCWHGLLGVGTAHTTPTRTVTLRAHAKITLRQFIQNRAPPRFLHTSLHSLARICAHARRVATCGRCCTQTRATRHAPRDARCEPRATHAPRLNSHSRLSPTTLSPRHELELAAAPPTSSSVSCGWSCLFRLFGAAALQSVVRACVCVFVFCNELLVCGLIGRA